MHKLLYVRAVRDEPLPPHIFIGSSTEGHLIARNLQAELGSQVSVDRWDQNVFEPGGYALDSLIRASKAADFAVLIATPDDTVTSRAVTAPAARDNILLEFGLFSGALGRERTFILATGDMRLPSDILGVTRLPYRSGRDDNLRAAVSDAALQIHERVRSLGRLERHATSSTKGSGVSPLEMEIELLCRNAVAQGWTVKTNSLTTLRLVAPSRRAHTLRKGPAEKTRVELRDFTARLRAGGLRVNSSLRRPVADSPL